MLTAVSSCGFFLLHSSRAVFVLGTRDRIMVAVLWVCTDDVIRREPPPLCHNWIVRTLSVQNSMPLRMFSFWIPSQSKEGGDGSQSHSLDVGVWTTGQTIYPRWPDAALLVPTLSILFPVQIPPSFLFTLSQTSCWTVSALCFLCMDPEIKALVLFATLLHFPPESFVYNQDSAISELLSALHFLPCSLCQLVKLWGPLSLYSYLHL